jgi:hypothetical protein
MRQYALAVVLLVAFCSPGFSGDNGRYANDPLKYWFDHLSSGNGMCCSFADGRSVSDVDWDTHNNHYRASPLGIPRAESGLKLSTTWHRRLDLGRIRRTVN